MNPIQLTGYELHVPYGKDQLQLMPRDAHTLYVYWEVSDRRKWLTAQHFQCDWGQLPKVLRVYDVTSVYFHGSNANSYFDIETTPEAINWYIPGLQANTTYLIDYGVYTWERQFVPLLRSNAVTTSRDTAADWGEPLVAVSEHLPGEHARHRIPPHLFEHFQPYMPVVYPY